MDKTPTAETNLEAAKRYLAAIEQGAASETMAAFFDPAASGSRPDARIKASWPLVDGRIDGWWGARKTPHEDGCSVIEAKLWPSTKLANYAALMHRSGYLRLDNA